MTRGLGPVLPFAVALLVAVLTRALFQFDGLYGQDAFAYFRFARAIGPHLLNGAPLPDLFWPRGYPVAVAALLPLTGGGPAAGQIVSALACAWAAAATFLLVRALERDGGRQIAALVAGIAVAGSGAVLRYSQLVMADALALALAATAMLCAARYVLDRRGPWLVACAVALAWGAVTRWLVGLLALPVGVHLFLAWRGRSPGDARRIAWVWFLVAAVAGLAVLLPQLAVARAVPRMFARHEWLDRWSLAHAFQRDFETREGPWHYKLPAGIFYLVRLAWPDYLFPGVALFAVAGLWVLVRERRWPAAALLLGWPAVAWLFLSGIPYENPRFLLPTLPAIGALCGIGFARVARALRPRRRPALVALFTVSLAAGLAFGAREDARVVARKNADLGTVAWLASEVPAGATVLMSGGTLVFEHYGSTQVRDIYLLSPAELAAALDRGGPYYYCENPDEIAARWSGLSPALHQEALRARGLTLVSRHPPHVLYRVAPARR